jgi:hypothetical protein
MKYKPISIACRLILVAGVVLIMANVAATTEEGKASFRDYSEQPGGIELQGSAVDDNKPAQKLLKLMKLPASPAELLTLGSTWEVAECCGWTGLWKRRPGTNTFDGSWRHTNGTVVTDTVVLQGWDQITNQVVFTRTYNNGSYFGTLNPSNGTISNGTASWYPVGATWSAKLYAEREDPKGKVTIPLRSKK